MNIEQELAKKFTKYTAHDGSLTKSSVIYKFAQMDGFDCNLKYFDTEMVLREIKQKIIDKAEENSIQRGPGKYYEHEKLFPIMIPILDEFFKDIEKDVDHIFNLMMKNKKTHALYMEDQNTKKYKLNPNCVFFGEHGIKYKYCTWKKAKMNPQHTLETEKEVISQTKEFIRSILINATIGSHSHSCDREGSLTSEKLKMVIDSQFGNTNALFHFILILYSEDFREDEAYWIQGLKKYTNSFTVNRIMASTDKSSKIYQDGYIGSFLAYQLCQFFSNIDQIIMDSNNRAVQELQQMNRILFVYINDNPKLPHEQIYLNVIKHHKKVIVIFIVSIFLLLVFYEIYKYKTKTTPTEINRLSV